MTLPVMLEEVAGAASSVEVEEPSTVYSPNTVGGVEGPVGAAGDGGAEPGDEVVALEPGGPDGGLPAAGLAVWLRSSWE